MGKMLLAGFILDFFSPYFKGECVRELPVRSV